MLLKPEEIPWGEAPEDAEAAATHPSAIKSFGMWRKFVAGVVYRHRDGKWEHHHPDEETWKKYNNHVMRPVAVEAELPGGIQWMADYDYYQAGAGAFFFNREGFFYNGQPGKWRGEAAINYWIHHDKTIKRFPDKPVAQQEQPKRKVGWW